MNKISRKEKALREAERKGVQSAIGIVFDAMADVAAQEAEFRRSIPAGMRRVYQSRKQRDYYTALLQKNPQEFQRVLTFNSLSLLEAKPEHWRQDRWERRRQRYILVVELMEQIQAVEGLVGVVNGERMSKAEFDRRIAKLRTLPGYTELV
jgi:hypothetical protein